MSSDSTSGHNCGSGSRSPNPPSVPRSVFSVAHSGRECKRRSNNHDDFYDDDDFAPASAPTPHRAIAVDATVPTAPVSASWLQHRQLLPYPRRILQIIYDKEKASSAQIQARLDSIWREHGDSYIEGIQPVFDALKARHFDSSWNWVRQDAILMSYEILLGRLTTVDREITARCIAIIIPPAQLPRPPVPALPPQISQASSTRSIPPSSSSLPYPSPISSRPSWPGQRSRVSSTLHLHPHPAHQSQQRSNRAQKAPVILTHTIPFHDMVFEYINGKQMLDYSSRLSIPLGSQ